MIYHHTEFAELVVNLSQVSFIAKGEDMYGEVTRGKYNIEFTTSAGAEALCRFDKIEDRDEVFGKLTKYFKVALK